MAKILKSLKKRKFTQISIRLEAEDLEKIKEKADKYAKGNLSEFIRYAALNFIPTDKDLA